jgi:low affinity Fe/Cu permease
MNKFRREAERIFERLVLSATAILGNRATFIIALCLVIFWFSNKKFHSQDIHYMVGDVILGVTFLCMFIIQKSFNRFSAEVHLKINELVASNETASNKVINLESKTEHEITALSKEYDELLVLEKEVETETK